MFLQTQLGSQYDARLRTERHAYSALLSRLGLAYKLHEHGGCVNTVTWNSGGTILLSGSDDCRIGLWSVHPTASLIAAVPTGHVRNIFCAKFLPESADHKVVSSALDGTVRLTDITHTQRPKDELLGACTQFVSKLEFVPGSAHAFLAAGQDGHVALYDLRVPHDEDEERKRVHTPTTRPRRPRPSLRAPTTPQAAGRPLRHRRVHDARLRPRAAAPLLRGVRGPARAHVRHPARVGSLRAGRRIGRRPRLCARRAHGRQSRAAAAESV